VRSESGRGAPAAAQPSSHAIATHDAARTLRSAWLRRPWPRERARVRLFLFAHAGGGASTYRDWSRLASRGVDVLMVQLPGREQRIFDPPYRSMSALVEAVTTEIAALADCPVAFFGHSLGALVAFEVARAMSPRLQAAVEHLFVSAVAAPHRRSRAPNRLVSNRMLLSEVARLGGTPAAVLDNQEMHGLALAALRADLAVFRSYRYRSAPPLSIPITALGGRHDPQVTVADLSAWKHQTRRSFAVELFDGGHFYLQDARPKVMKTILDALSPRRRRPERQVGARIRAQRIVHG